MVKKPSQAFDKAEECGARHATALKLYVSDANLQAESRSERLKNAVSHAGGSAKVAKRIGIHPNNFTKYFQGRDPQLSILVAIADACGVSVEWLATGRGSDRPEWITVLHPSVSGYELGPGEAVAQGPIMPLPTAAPGSSYVAIPRYNVAASAGGGALVDHSQIVEYLAFDEQYVRQHLRREPKDLLLIEARGDSMEPTIRHGDILTVDIGPDRPLAHSQLYVLRVGESLLVKRLEQRLSGLVLHSDNPRYSPETIPRAEVDTLHILGQVLLVSSPPR